MKTEENVLVNSTQDYRRYYLREFELYDGDHFVTFNIISVDTDKNEITLAVSNEGRISVITYDLRTDNDGCLYFEYGVMLERVAVGDFEQSEDLS